MSQDAHLLAETDRPEWLEYPYGFRTLVDYGVTQLLLWQVMSAKQSIAHASGLAERYPDRVLFPFAFRQDNDDVACWSKGDGEKVTIIHDFASPGYEFVGECKTIGDWLRFVVEDFIDWEPIAEPKVEAVAKT